MLNGKVKLQSKISRYLETINLFEKSNEAGLWNQTGKERQDYDVS